jgi:hypothetical protein
VSRTERGGACCLPMLHAVQCNTNDCTNGKSKQARWWRSQRRAQKPRRDRLLKVVCAVAAFVPSCCVRSELNRRYNCMGGLRGTFHSNQVQPVVTAFETRQPVNNGRQACVASFKHFSGEHLGPATTPGVTAGPSIIEWTAASSSFQRHHTQRWSAIHVQALLQPCSLCGQPCILSTLVLRLCFLEAHAG